MIAVKRTIRKGRGRTNDHLVETHEGRRVEVSRLFYRSSADDPVESREVEEVQHQQCGGGRRILRKKIGGA